MHILITGGTGFIGSNLAQYFLAQNNQVTVLSRDKTKQIVGAKVVDDLNEVNSSPDVVINLAGEPLDRKRWNEKVKREIYESRISTTRKVVDYINNLKRPPTLFITGSAVGFYGHSKNKIFTEIDISPKNDFPSKLCYDWESEAQKVRNDVRFVRLRLGVVLGRNGGILSKMLLPFKLCLGTMLGSGEQFMSWVHLDDVMQAINFIISNKELEGPVNMTSPTPVTNKVFTQNLAGSLGRFSFLCLPNFVIKILFGEMGDALLINGQNVIPQKLLDAGYQFKYSDLNNTLKNLLTS